MHETFFEMLERTHAIDWVLGAMVVVGPVAVGLLWRWLRVRPAFQRHAHSFIIAATAGPFIYAMWRIYNGIMNHFGLDSVRGLLLSAAVFLIAGTLAGVAHHLLAVALEQRRR